MKPVIGITMGDPSSIGPEITRKVFAGGKIFDSCRPLVVGDAAVLAAAEAYVGRDGLKIHAISSPAEAVYEKGTVDVLDMKAVTPSEIQIGTVSARAGDAAFRYVEKVIDLALAGQVDATVTNAISKEAINLAGHHYAGHTEIYAQKTGTEHYTMMLACGTLRVVHVSTHVSLRKACDLVKKERILEVIRIADDACRRMGIVAPRIGVAGLNPHSGENGMFGTEEIEEIAPAVRQACLEGISADGPVPPDTVFSKARGGFYDIVVAMYHDQGHIPLKVTGFVYNHEKEMWDAVEGVNITLGLPIIRTSVDHGTAFDQAGKGTASELSLENAISYAVLFASARNQDAG